MLAEAERVICPSRDAAGHVASQVDGPQLIVAPHDTLAHEEFPAPAPPKLMAGEPLRVAILGVLSKDKGARVVVESLRALRATPSRVDMTLIGWVDEDARRRTQGTGLATTGPYRPEELSWYLGRVRPHVVWFPAVWPETYSYTLSEAMLAGLPVLVPDLGAFSERVAGRSWSWCVPWDTSPSRFGAAFAHIGDQLRSGVWEGLELLGPVGSDTAARYPIAATSDFYDVQYLKPAWEAAAGDPDGISA
jgi:glycosyltransferase involved in cell wall biosynthesis